MSSQPSSSSILRREIRSQPAVLERIIRRELSRARAVARRIKRYDPQVVVLVARGSADNAGIYGKYLFGAHNRKIVALATPSLFTQYGKPPDLGRALVVAISQSGESYDVVEVVQGAREMGALTLAITNTPGSPLAEAAEEILLCHAGPERSVAATKTYTAQVLLLALLSSALADSSSRLEALREVPERVEEALQVEPAAARAAERMRYLEQCAVVGRGYCYGTSFEIALKLAELTYVSAQPYSSADFRHGPIAVVDPDFCAVVLAPRGRVLGDVKLLQEQLQERRGEVVAISDVPTVLRRATVGLATPRKVPEWLAPLTCVVPGQLLAMNLCRVKGYSLDRPRGLTKVTRTR